MEIYHYHPEYSDLQIQLHEVAELIGYKDTDVPAPVDEIILQAIEMAGEYCKIEGGIVLPDDVLLVDEKKMVRIGDLEFRIKGRLFKELKGSEKIALFLCTAGSEISKVAKELMKKGDLLPGYIFDVIGSVTVERAMDEIQRQFGEKMQERGYKITNRYSPGYCGWQTEEQFKLFKIFPDNFCKVSLTDSALMYPIKSVSGMIGIGRDVHYNEYNCDLCDAVNCIYRKP
ncbi:MAG: vitamin B12 dependent-methionine synthase activation domain-containing protein [Bacteroidales bacterium]